MNNKKHKTSVEKKEKKKKKDLLVKDLASRLPYGNTFLYIKHDEGRDRVKLDFEVWHSIKSGIIDIDHVKVVLKPMNTLSDEDMSGLFAAVFGHDIAKDEVVDTNDWIKFRGDGEDIEFIFFRRSYKDVLGFYDYCYSHNLDVNGLGEVGLGEAPVYLSIIL